MAPHFLPPTLVEHATSPMNTLRQLCKSKRISYLRDSGLPQTRASIEDWERSLPGSLPADYKEFMAHFNGGKFIDSGSFDMRGRAVPGGMPFHAIGAESYYWLNAPAWAHWMDLKQCQSLHAGRIPGDTIAIGESGGSNLILIDFANKGELVLWEREMEFRVAAELNRVSIAPSLLDLLNQVEFEPFDELLENVVAEAQPYDSIEVGDLAGLARWVRDVNRDFASLDERLNVLVSAVAERFYPGASWLLKHNWLDQEEMKRCSEPLLMAAIGSRIGDMLVLLLEHGVDANLLSEGTMKISPYMNGFHEEWRLGLRGSSRMEVT